MTYDTKPGGLDGPPIEEVEGPFTKAARLFFQGIAVAFVAVFMLALLVAAGWGIAWMLTHFPTP